MYAGRAARIEGAKYHHQKKSGFPVCIGENNDATGRHFHGSIDEVDISSVVRSDAWMLAEHRTVAIDTTLTFGVDQTVP